MYNNCTDFQLIETFCSCGNIFVMRMHRNKIEEIRLEVDRFNETVPLGFSVRVVENITLLISKRINILTTYILESMLKGRYNTFLMVLLFNLQKEDT